MAQIRYTTEPSGNDIVTQADGYIDGIPFFFHARRGRWELFIGRHGQTPDDLPLIRYAACGSYEGDTMTAAEVKDAVTWYATECAQ